MNTTRIRAHVLNERSVKNLAGVHPDLVRVVEQAVLACGVAIVVTEGLRTPERQAELKAAGKSWTLDSRHLTGHAVDLVDADNYGYDIPDLDAIAKAMKASARELEIKIVWGGDWKTRDTPHFELDREAYPASGVTIGTKFAETVGNVASDRRVLSTTFGMAGVGVPVAAPFIPAIPDYIAATVSNASAWSKLATSVDLRVLLIGGGVAGLTALVMRLIGRGA
jgi:peptidoglycan L-alanyl-D-glutamate endopeptidase CwlK